MNRFLEIMERLKLRAIEDKELNKFLSDMPRAMDQHTENKPPLRLPYSSDPDSIEEAWRD